MITRIKVDYRNIGPHGSDIKNAVLPYSSFATSNTERGTKRGSAKTPTLLQKVDSHFHIAYSIDAKSVYPASITLICESGRCQAQGFSQHRTIRSQLADALGLGPSASNGPHSPADQQCGAEE